VTTTSPPTRQIGVRPCDLGRPTETQPGLRHEITLDCDSDVHRLEFRVDRLGRTTWKLWNHHLPTERVLASLGGTAPWCTAVPKVFRQLRTVEPDPVIRADWIAFGVRSVREAQDWCRVSTVEDARKWRAIGVATPAEVAGWFSRGLTPELARCWLAEGHQASTASWWAHLGVRVPAEMAPWAAVGVTDAADALAWATLGVRMPAGVAPWLAAGASGGRDAMAWARGGTAIGDIRAWQDAGVGHGDDQCRWRICGVGSLAELARWRAAGVDDVGEAQAWVIPRFVHSVAEVARWKAHGYTPDTARAASASGRLPPPVRETVRLEHHRITGTAGGKPDLTFATPQGPAEVYFFSLGWRSTREAATSWVAQLVDVPAPSRSGQMADAGPAPWEQAFGAPDVG
jgi:hypothetical protein